MNQNGWGLKDAVLFIVIICLALLISIATYHKTFKGASKSGIEDETYADMEEELENAAHTYTDNYYYKVLEDGDSGVVTIRDMQAENIITVVKDIEDDSILCSGYVTFAKEDSVTTYTTYLKCGDNYETKGYKAKYDEPVKTEKELRRSKISGQS